MKSLMLIRRWWYWRRMAVHCILSRALGGRRGPNSSTIADALREPVCVSNSMVRCMRTLGSIGDGTNSGSFDRGKKSLSMISGSSDVISDNGGLADELSLGSLSDSISAIGKVASSTCNVGSEACLVYISFSAPGFTWVEFGVKGASELPAWPEGPESILDRWLGWEATPFSQLDTASRKDWSLSLVMLCESLSEELINLAECESAEVENI